MHVAGIGIAHAVFHRDPARVDECGRRCRRDVAHLPVRVKRGEVHRHVGPEIFRHPLRHFLELLLRVIEAGNEQGGDLEPYLGFVLEVLERVEHGLQMRAGHLPVEILGEGLEVHVGRVHVLVKLAPWLVAHVACGDRHGFNAEFAAGLGDINRILHEDRRIVIGISHAAAIEFLGRARDGLGRSLIHQRVEFARFADVPVLAELARQVAAGGAEGKDRGAGEKMIERFLLDRVHAIAAGAAIGGQHNLTVMVAAHEAQATLAFVQLAVTRAHVALHPPVVELVPVAGRDHRRRIEDFRFRGHE